MLSSELIVTSAPTIKTEGFISFCPKDDFDLYPEGGKE